MKGHIIDGTEWGHSGLTELCARAIALKQGASPIQFPSKRVGMLFMNPSLRTRASMECASVALGMHPLVLQPGKDSWALETRDGVVMNEDKPEHIKDAIQVLSGYVDIFSIRSFAGLTDHALDVADGIIHMAAAHSQAPVVNLESAQWHPMQGFADAATWMEAFGPDLRGIPLTLTWAPHPKPLPQAVPNQVLLTAAQLGMDVRIANPEGFALDSAVIQRSTRLAEQNGGGVRCYSEAAHAAQRARVVVAKSWSGSAVYTDPAREAESRIQHSDWMVSDALLEHTDNAGFMHCLPVRRNVVVSDAVLDGTRSWVQTEANFRLWTAMAALERLLMESA